ncbi:protein SCAI [Iris pallida]|uniref:Protein SCAI n=1 Tax=Iris pallida TaxID=29817 RepID=A0AAX6FMZ8_IRIPA|nr:protein SCAI [Iris pallida]
MTLLHSSSSSSLGKDSTMASGAKSSVPVTELFWSLLDKADRKFSKLRDLPSFSRHSKDADFHKAFRIYTQLWRLQQEHRRELLDAGLKRSEIGEVAARIAQLYYGQYQRTSDPSYLAEAFAFCEAVLARDYFKGGEASAARSKQLRFLVRFLLVAIVAGRREMASRLADMLGVLVGECEKSFQEAESKEWKYILQEVDRFLRADSLFMNLRPLRYSFVYDSHPYSLTSVVPCNGKRSLVLHDALLSSYCQNEVKFTELTLNTFRMLQILEWELRGFVSLKGSADGSFNGRDHNRVKPLQDIKDPSLRPNPWKVILYRPSVTHLLMVLSTLCEELPPDGILLIYLSASGEGTNLPMTSRSGIDQDSCDIISERSDHDTASSASSPTDSPIVLSSHNTENHKSIRDSCLWLGSRGSKGSKYLYPSDLIPFTRKPLFLVIDSNNSHAFKAGYSWGRERRNSSDASFSKRSSSTHSGFQ